MHRLLSHFLRPVRALIAALLCLPLVALALPGDRDQPIHITADKALRDEVRGVTVYTGNVHLVQGSMELDADRLTIYHHEDVADEIIAEGKPARMRQQPEIDKGIVHAHALVITYYKYKELVHLQTEARIEQDGSVVDGDAINYFIEKQLITAESDQSNEDARVEVIIPPSVQKGSDEPAEPTQAEPSAVVPNPLADSAESSAPSTSDEEEATPTSLATDSAAASEDTANGTAASE